MTLIEFKNVSAGYFDKILYSDINLTINKGDKIVILGENGVGKSTFLKLIKGSEDCVCGNVEIDENLKISYLDQYFPISEKATVEQLLDQPFSNIIKIESEIADLQIEMSELMNDDIIEKYDRKVEEFERLGGYDYVILQQKFMQIFGFANMSKREFSTLSGGEKQYMRLAMALFGQGELIILDEPSTFFDKSKNSWLIKYIKESPKTFLIICHDDDFILSVPTKIIDIDNKEVLAYNCGYRDFLQEKKNYLEKQEEENNIADLAISDKKAALSRKCYWMEETEDKHHHAVTIRRLTREIEKLENDKFEFTKKTEYDYTIKTPKYFKESGEIWIDFKNVEEEIGGKFLYKNVNFKFYRNERITISGNNGAGKTTFIKMIMGLVAPTGGSVYVDDKVEIAHIPQDAFFEDENITVFEYCKNISRVGDILLEEYIDSLFENDVDYRIKRLYMLSGGESKRLQILSYILSGAQLLILDEPTTFMDGYSKTKLVEMLEKFDGGIILVTHDKELMKNLGFTRYRIENNRFVEL